MHVHSKKTSSLLFLSALSFVAVAASSDQSNEDMKLSGWMGETGPGLEHAKVYLELIKDSSQTTCDDDDEGRMDLPFLQADSFPLSFNVHDLVFSVHANRLQAAEAHQHGKIELSSSDKKPSWSGDDWIPQKIEIHRPPVHISHFEDSKNPDAELQLHYQHRSASNEWTSLSVWIEAKGLEGSSHHSHSADHFLDRLLERWEEGMLARTSACKRRRLMQEEDKTSGSGPSSGETKASTKRTTRKLRRQRKRNEMMGIRIPPAPDEFFATDYNHKYFDRKKRTTEKKHRILEEQQYASAWFPSFTSKGNNDFFSFLRYHAELLDGSIVTWNILRDPVVVSEDNMERVSTLLEQAMECPPTTVRAEPAHIDYQEVTRLRCNCDRAGRE